MPFGGWIIAGILFAGIIFLALLVCWKRRGQSRIRQWFSDVTAGYRVFIFTMLAMVCVYFVVYFLFPSIFPDFLASFTAGFLGILIGFGLDRHIELRIKNRITKQIVNSLLVELNNNLDSVKELKSVTKPQDIRYFELLQTNAWDMFSSRLELDNTEVLFDLGSVYHRLHFFNEGMKLESLGGELTMILERTPNFLEQLEKDLGSIIGRLDSVKI